MKSGLIFVLIDSLGLFGDAALDSKPGIFSPKNVYISSLFLIEVFTKSTLTEFSSGFMESEAFIEAFAEAFIEGSILSTWI